MMTEMMTFFVALVCVHLLVQQHVSYCHSVTRTRIHAHAFTHSLTLTYTTSLEGEALQPQEIKFHSFDTFISLVLVLPNESNEPILETPETPFLKSGPPSSPSPLHYSHKLTELGRNLLSEVVHTNHKTIPHTNIRIHMFNKFSWQL